MSNISHLITDATSSEDSSRKIPLYEASTQFKHWRYSLQQLAHIRTSLNKAAVAVIRNKFEIDELGSSTHVQFLVAEEEQLLVKLYLTKITQLCGLFHFPEEVEATAVSYMKRFYLKNTVMDWHPKNVMLTALFLATKTTNNPISLETYISRIPKTTPNDVLDLEFLVAQSLNFEFTVWHAHRALWGIWLDIQNLTDTIGPLPPTVYDSALSHVRSSRLTDAELIYTPSQIALAAMYLVSPDVALKWSHWKMGTTSQGLGTDVQLIIETVVGIITKEGHAPVVESVREVDRRLKLCKNPEKVPGTKAYLAKKAHEERKAEEKRIKKATEVEKATQGDPFGQEFSGSRSALVDYDDDDDDDDEE
ncbi:cyclin-like protein [Cyathus striatus]|nr:cyclin-like protein [Cyathus striatus]